MRVRVAITAMLVLGSIGVVPGVARATSVTAESVIAQAYQQWWDALGPRQGCASGVTITLEELPSRRGEYRVATQQVVIDPSGDVATLPGIVIHELSHHAFLSCGAFADENLTEAFLSAQQLPLDRDWFDYSAGWEQAPVEHFAEAMSTSILGADSTSLRVSPEAVRVIRLWLAAAPIMTSPPPDEYAPIPYAPAVATADRRGDDQVSEPDQSKTMAAGAVEIKRDATPPKVDADEPPPAVLEMLRWANTLRSLILWPR